MRNIIFAGVFLLIACGLAGGLIGYGAGAEVNAETIQIEMGTLGEGDCDGDQNVGVSDFMIFQASWLTSPTTNPVTDFNRDGNTGVSDFMIFQMNWLTTSPVEVTE